jgi:ATP-binding cassette subfamily B protein
MWNRQREAEEAREKLARADEDPVAPNRDPPAVPEPPEAPRVAQPAAEPAAAAE